MLLWNLSPVRPFGQAGVYLWLLHLTSQHPRISTLRYLLMHRCDLMRGAGVSECPGDLSMPPPLDFPLDFGLNPAHKSECVGLRSSCALVNGLMWEFPRDGVRGTGTETETGGG